MLSRTADNLYWIARYMERAETTARLLEVGARIALMPSAGHGYRNEWDSLLRASGTAAGFAQKYGDPVQRNIESYLFFDRDNPSSVASCIERARENARIVRTALTTQVW
ncbi:alpha-E domain-containing protein, partial [Candidatus Falkowbacteria bacterium]|nr:alpha-E domain-containing protein [Candidatus Falkowbacteria bacterium]